MYCSTCGSRVAEGRSNCQVCGAALTRMPMAAASPTFAPAQPYAMAGAQPYAMGGPMHVCPRCGFRGMSASYFSRAGHIIALAALTIFFAPAAVVYLLMRLNHRACPSCGMGWGNDSSRALTLLPNGSAVPATTMADPAFAREGSGKSVGAWVLLVMAGILITAGLANFEFPPILFGMLFAGGGATLLKRAKTRREERREAILQSLQLPVLQLAGRKGGRLTVTDVATEMAWPMARAEKVLNSLDDGLRVMSDITDDGVIVYDFLEIRAAQLPRGGRGAMELPA